MNSSVLASLFNIRILLLIVILFNNLSTIFCGKSIPLRSGAKTRHNSGSNKGKKLWSNTTISRKLAAHGSKWHYGEKWPGLGYENCGGSQQSPIRLMTPIAVRNSSLHLRLDNYNLLIRQAFVENNGHTVQIGFKDRFQATLYGTATNYEKYIFKQLHFHWGSYGGVGSEHTVDGYRGPMEMHLVHYNAKYAELDDACDKPDGLMVLGVLFRTTSRNNLFMASVIRAVRKVPNYEDESSLINRFSLGQLLPVRKRPFFMYKGSLTTPPCYESVQWLVFKNQALIGDAQERQFRKLRSEYISAKTGKKRALSNNYRPVQALNERQIFISS